MVGGSFVRCGGGWRFFRDFGRAGGLTGVWVLACAHAGDCAFDRSARALDHKWYAIAAEADSGSALLVESDALLAANGLDAGIDKENDRTDGNEDGK